MANNDAVALYWDFENIHASLLDQQQGHGTYRATCFRPQDELIDVSAIVEFALSLGPVAINRAFANWVSFTRYRFALLRNAVELIQVFSPGANAKNGADIKLCLDVMDDMARFPHVRTIIVVGGDSDYMPLSYKVKAAGRTLVGIGSRVSTNQHWARSCHEFRYYESLLSVNVPKSELPMAPGYVTTSGHYPASENSSTENGSGETNPNEELRLLLERAAEAEKRHQAMTELVCRAITLLSERRGEVWVQKAGLRPFIQRMDPTFQESNFGFDTFSDLLISLGDVIETRRGEHDQEVRIAQRHTSASEA
ncbi:NYN domain-containing protein [Azohydromonas sp. G-1-1-14]|uniref:NYN domain-containing protein n=2 Tax=Azohydromonas caseinilytica TaxID=2728836 RepID=A0A848F9H5_9BURK|nr:NYN domain-containing protein [Azohydromonas caseinilytica]